MFELGPVISTKGFRLRHHCCECLYKLQSLCGLQTLRNLCNHYAFVELSSFRGNFSCLKSVGAWQSSSDTYFLRVATGRRSRFVHGKNTSRLLNFYLASDATMQLAIIPIVSGPLSTKYVVIHLPNISKGVKFLLLSFCCCIL